jgi:hypothetical protein
LILGRAASDRQRRFSLRLGEGTTVVRSQSAIFHACPNARKRLQAYDLHLLSRSNGDSPPKPPGGVVRDEEATQTTAAANVS